MNGGNSTRGFTMIETVLVVALVGILFSVLMPYFSTLNKTWAVFDAKSEELQNARVALDYFNGEFKQAYRILSISDDSDTQGFLSFEKPDGTIVNLELDTSGSEKVFALEDSGTYHDIASPISELTFIGYDALGATTDVTALVRSVELSVLMEDQILSGNRYTSTVSLAKDTIESLYFALYSSSNITLSDSGTINGDVHANGSIDDLASSTVINGTQTDSTDTTDITLPEVPIDDLVEDYEDLSAYEAIADVISTVNYIFQSGQTYNGVYYVGNGNHARIQDNVVINGSVIAEGDVRFQGTGSSIIPSPNMPAVVAGDDVNVQGDFTWAIAIEGTVYAHDDVNIIAGSFEVNGNGKYNISVAAGDDILSACSYPEFTGATIAGDDMVFNVYTSAEFTGDNALPALIAGDRIQFSNGGSNIIISGIAYSKGPFLTYGSSLTHTGSILAGGDVTIDSTINLSYQSSYLKSPPVYMWATD